MKKVSIYIIILFLISGLGRLVYSAGSNSAEFLQLGVGARPMGLGGAFVAVCDDPNGMYWNPAGASRIRRKEITMMHNEHFQDINYQMVAYAHPIQGTQITLGGGINYLSLKNIDGYNVSGEATGKFNIYNACGLLCFSQGIGQYLSFGINAKAIMERLEEEEAQGLTFDIGGLVFSPREDFSLGLSLQNIGGSLKFVREKEPLPRNTKIGLAYRTKLEFPFSEDLTIHTGKDRRQIHNFIASLDLNMPMYDSNYIALGSEYWLYEWFAVRLGYRTKSDIGDGLHYGLGFAYRDLGIDYAFVPYGDLGSSHRVSFYFIFGSPRKAFSDVIREEQIAIHLAQGERYYQDGALIAAKEEFIKVLDLDRNNKEAKQGIDRIVNVIYMQGLDLYESAKYNEALIQWEKVLELQPNHAGAQKYLNLTKKKIAEKKRLSQEELRRKKEEEEKRKRRRKELIPIK